MAVESAKEELMVSQLLNEVTESIAKDIVDVSCCNILVLILY